MPAEPPVVEICGNIIQGEGVRHQGFRNSMKFCLGVERAPPRARTGARKTIRRIADGRSRPARKPKQDKGKDGNVAIKA